MAKNIKLHREIPKSNLDPIIKKKITQDKNLEFTIRNISMKQMRDQINQMKATPSTGIDDLSLKTLKNLQPTIDQALLNIINTTFGTAKYPNCLKTAKVIPLLKEGKPPTDPLSYRGVNILPAIGKIIDSMIKNQITQHLETNTYSRGHRKSDTLVNCQLSTVNCQL